MIPFTFLGIYITENLWLSHTYPDQENRKNVTRSFNHHIIVVMGFEYLNDSRSYGIEGLMSLVGSRKANRSLVMGLTKSCSKNALKTTKDHYVARVGVARALPWGGSTFP